MCELGSVSPSSSTASSAEVWSGWKNPLWLARALEGTTCVPKDVPLQPQTPVVWGRQKESKGDALGCRSSPLCPDVI